MNKRSFSFKPLFDSVGDSNYRIPSVVITKRGTILAFCNDRRYNVGDRTDEHWLCVRRAEYGKDFEDTVVLAAKTGWGCGIGNAFYDREVDRVICLFSQGPNSKEAVSAYEALPEDQRPPVGTMAAVSDDDGRTFHIAPVTVSANALGKQGFSHGAAAGIQLQHGAHAGRLISAARYFVKPEDPNMDYEDLEHLKKGHWNCSLYSDDHGATWHTGGPVQVGTGEGALMELSDGRIMLNSRAYFHDGKRRVAWSEDGGETFGHFRLANDLTEIAGGVNASMIAVPLPDGSEIYVYASINNREAQIKDPAFSYSNYRRNLSVWISYDGITWPIVKTVYPGPSAYNSLAYDAEHDRFAMLIEYGMEGEGNVQRGIGIAYFNLAWLMAE